MTEVVSSEGADLSDSSSIIKLHYLMEDANRCDMFHVLFTPYIAFCPLNVRPLKAPRP